MRRVTHRTDDMPYRELGAFGRHIRRVRGGVRRSRVCRGCGNGMASAGDACSTACAERLDDVYADTHGTPAALGEPQEPVSVATAALYLCIASAAAFLVYLLLTRVL